MQTNNIVQYQNIEVQNMEKDMQLVNSILNIHISMSILIKVYKMFIKMTEDWIIGLT